MTDTTKEILEKYQIRKTKKQKANFIEYVERISKNYNYDFKIEKGSLGARNIIIGNPDTAKVIYTAHYDTCPRLPFPNFITPKNFLIYLLYQFFIAAIFCIIALLTIFTSMFVIRYILITTNTYSLLYDYLSFLPSIITYILIILMVAGPANKHTANDNTSGVTTLLDIMSKLPENQKDKVAFIFFDLEEMGVIGASSFASKHKCIKKNSLVINFDCVSDGKTILFALKRTTKKYAELLEKAFIPNDIFEVDITTQAFYPSDNAAFKGGIGVSALKKSKFLGILYMNRIHTNKDVIYQEENIEFLTNGAVKLAEML